jgi:plasmid stabilization system protein ParE
MAKTVKWTEAAWADLDAIADYIAADSAFYAAAFVREVREAARSLNIMPERGSIVPELENSKIREIFVRKYRLIYQVQKKQVLILGFIHGARDLKSLWKRERRRGSRGI